MKRLFLAGVSALCMLSAPHSANAAAGWEFTTPGESFTDGVWDFATAFTVNSSVSLSGLGYYADPLTGNVDGNKVSFYQCADTACLTTGTLLTSASVTNTYAIDGHFRYVTITPINLIAGDSYEVAGVSNVDNYTWSDPGFSVNSAISILSTSGQEARWSSSGSAGFLTGSPFLDLVGSDGYWGPNVFLGNPAFTGGVPEPSTWAMMLLGFAGLGFAGYRRAQRSVTMPTAA